MSIWSENKSWQATDALLGTRPSHNEDGTIFPKRDIISCLHMARRWCFVENSTVNSIMNWNSNSHIQTVEARCLNVFTIPLRKWGFWQCLPFSFSWTALRGKNCRHPCIAVIGVLDMLGQWKVWSVKNCKDPNIRLTTRSNYTSIQCPLQKILWIICFQQL